MKFVALLSGGKDSIFATMEAEKHGHELVCAAHLTPKGNEDELDSFCFQTVAHNCVQGIAQCLDVPLIQRAFDGVSTNQALNYSKTEGDEVEDLFELLREVLEKHPEIEGVCSGAILSTYQRTRVEACCSRLHLTSLAYLWQRPQRQLLKDMARSGLKAIIVKTATLGLEPEDLGLELHTRETRRCFALLNEKYEFHECGEGGEYESLVLDCPRFTKRLSLTETKVMKCDDQPKGCGAVAFLSVGKWALAAKEARVDDVSDDDTVEIEAEDVFEGEVNEPVRLETDVKGFGAGRIVRCSVGDAGRGLAACGGNLPSTKGGDAPTQLAQALAACDAALREKGFAGLEAVLFAHLYLRDLSTFGDVNAIFEEAFASCTMVPSRSCVQAPLPTGVYCVLDVEATSSKRKTLHVRSRSGWAPQCLGPYCQSNAMGTVTFVAGQVPLDAATMSLQGGGARLAFTHAAAVLKAEGASLENALSVVAYVAGNYDHRHLLRAAKTYELRPDAILCVRVPALPKEAPCEVEVVAFDEPTHIWRNASKAAGCVVYVYASFVPRGFCACVVRVCAPRKGEAQALDLAMSLGALVGACHLALAKAGLRAEHWCRLRVFAPAASMNAGAAYALLEDLLEGEDADAPGVTVVPVDALEPGVALAAQVIGCDLGALAADAWLRGGGGGLNVVCGSSAAWRVACLWRRSSTLAGADAPPPRTPAPRSSRGVGGRRRVLHAPRKVMSTDSRARRVGSTLPSARFGVPPRAGAPVARGKRYKPREAAGSCAREYSSLVGTPPRSISRPLAAIRTSR
jgi:diphthine-ammonia ligase